MQKAIIPSIETVHLGHHDVVVWEDASISIENPLYQYLHDERLDHIRLAVGELPALHDLIGKILNKQ